MPSIALMKTLIIHPADRSTDDLKLVYKDLDVDLITDTYDKDLFNTVSKVDRTICLGHGIPQGLIGSGMRLCVNESFGGVFQNQPNNIYIWCNADSYVKEHGLSGFCTGMFISEPREASVFNIKATPEQLTYSNRLFSRLVNGGIRRGLSNEELVDFVLKYYSDVDNAALEYNKQRIYSFESGYMTRSWKTASRIVEAV